MTHPFPWKESPGMALVDANGNFVCSVPDDAARVFIVQAANQYARAIAVKSPLEAVLRMDAASKAE